MTAVAVRVATKTHGLCNSYSYANVPQDRERKTVACPQAIRVLRLRPSSLAPTARFILCTCFSTPWAPVLHVVRLQLRQPFRVACRHSLHRQLASAIALLLVVVGCFCLEARLFAFPLPGVLAHTLCCRCMLPTRSTTPLHHFPCWDHHLFASAATWGGLRCMLSTHSTLLRHRQSWEHQLFAPSTAWGRLRYMTR